MPAPKENDPYFRSIGDRVNESVQQGNDLQQQQDLQLSENPVQEVESYCVNCEKNGVTRLLLTSIPFFREVIIASFYCEHCGHSNSEVQSAGAIQPRGSVHTVKVTSSSDLDRQLVKNATATIYIPEFELTIPPSKGQLTNIEGIISDLVRDLEFEQPVRQHTAPEAYEKIEALLNKLRAIIQDHEKDKDEDTPIKEPFSFRIDDPSGNSFIQCHDRLNDPKWSRRDYDRTKEQDAQLGLGEGESGNNDAEQEEEPDNVISFPMDCSSCNAKINTLMRQVDIPHFKQVMIMSTNCEHCGYRDNEVKSSAAVSEKGTKITLQVQDSEDLARDILKSDTSTFSIPEIDLVLHRGTLGGRFTTLEGLLNQIYEELDTNVFTRGDSHASDSSEEVSSFLTNLKKVMAAEMQYTVIIDDPLSNSYIQNIYAPDDDPNMTIESYERTQEQNDDLGLSDMKVEGYEGEEEARIAREEADRKEAQEKAAAVSS